MSTEQMELMTLNAQNAVQIFTGGGMAAILDGIEAKVRSIPLDPSTATGREEIRSVAYQVARTKVALDAEGKKLTEGWREATKKVNEERKKATERLDALGEEIRKPLTDFENKDKIRVAEHEEALQDITGLHALVAASPDLSIVMLERYLIDLRSAGPDRNWEEFSARAKSAREEAEKYIVKRLEERKRYEVEQEELARLRREESERLQRERDEKLKSEAAEKARLEAERKAQEEAERIRLENERAAQAAEAARVREEQAKKAAERRAADAEAARIAAEKKREDERVAAEVRAKEAALKAERDRKAAEQKAAADLKAAKEKAKRDAEAAAAREREKIEQERKQAEADRIKREADEAHKDKIRGEITDDIYSYGMFDPEFPDRLHATVDAIMNGNIRNVKVIF